MGIREIAKPLVFRAARRTGVNAWLRRRFRGRLLGICYHGVCSRDHSHDPERYLYRNTVSVAEFSRQLELLRKYFTPVSTADLLDALDGRHRLPDRPVLVSFDDGYRNNLTLAAPILERYDIPALIGLATAHIGCERLLWTEEVTLRVVRWPDGPIPVPGEAPRRPAADLGGRLALAHAIRQACKRLPDLARRDYLEELRLAPFHLTDADRERVAFLSWDEVRILRRRGWEVASHTVNHPILTRLAPLELVSELQESKTVIERQLDTPCRAVVYPNGGRADFSPQVLEAARQTGYRVGFTLTGEINPAAPERLAVARTNITGHLPIDVFEAVISGLAAWIAR